MKVKLTVSISGLRDNVPWPALGEVVDLPDDEAAHMCAVGHAEPVVEDRVEKRPATKRAEKRG